MDISDANRTCTSAVDGEGMVSNGSMAMCLLSTQLLSSFLHVVRFPITFLRANNPWVPHSLIASREIKATVVPPPYTIQLLTVIVDHLLG